MGRKLRAILILTILLAFSGRNAFAATCESLTQLTLPRGIITAAQTVGTGTFVPPLPGARPLTNLRPFCRVSATLRPSPVSDVKIETWLPLTGWNRKFLAVGNGGWAGTIAYPAMGDALQRGYATTSTDTGHATPGGSFALEQERLIDFAYRSEHEMTVAAKLIVRGFYEAAPRFSYWNGCSTGGRQGLQEARRYANDYDGIVAGAPAHPTAMLDSWQLWIAQQVHRTTDSYIPADKYELLHRGVLEACDATDGVKDGVLENPLACVFEPATLQCTQSASSSSCLTPSQVETARRLFGPAVNPRTGEMIHPGWAPGTELAWGALAGPEPANIPVERFKYVVFRDEKWDWRTFDADRDVARAMDVSRGVIDMTGADLGDFARAGGKLLMYHGWSDPQVPPQGGIDHYKNIVASVGPTVKGSDWIKLFMVPGMGHCRGGTGTDSFDLVRVLEEWVENGRVPTRVVASRVNGGVTERTRPLCPYPQIARYSGTGSTDDARNFRCVAP